MDAQAQDRAHRIGQTREVRRVEQQHHMALDKQLALDDCGYLVRNSLLADGIGNDLHHPAVGGPEAYVNALHAEKLLKYNGVNFVAGNVGVGKPPEGWYCGNRGTARDGPLVFWKPGVVYGLSNGVLVDGLSTWPKVERGKRLLQLAG
ncbi:hypothetical protein HDU86_003475 [Geranomyces michiganensis]|nr:hypothetical protein HDU86_003475 [Geranomyces michiganensis]